MGSISGETIRRAASGDHGAFNEIYRAYEGGLRAYITSHINDKSQAEDVLQNTFVAVFKNIGQLKNPEGLKTWLYKIAYNECMNLNGVTKRETERYTPLSSFADEDGNEREFEDEDIELPEDFATNAELQRLLAKTLNSLPKNQRDCLVLYYYRQKPIAEIAQMLGVSENAVKLRKKSALERLKRKLEKYRKSYNFAFAPMGLLLHKLVGTGKVKSAYTGAAVVRTAGASLAAACTAGVIGIGAIGYFGIKQYNDNKPDQKEDSSISEAVDEDGWTHMNIKSRISSAYFNHGHNGGETFMLIPIGTNVSDYGESLDFDTEPANGFVVGESPDLLLNDFGVAKEEYKEKGYEKNIIPTLLDMSSTDYRFLQLKDMKYKDTQVCMTYEPFLSELDNFFEYDPDFFERKPKLTVNAGLTDEYTVEGSLTVEDGLVIMSFDGVEDPGSYGEHIPYDENMIKYRDLHELNDSDITKEILESGSIWLCKGLFDIKMDGYYTCIKDDAALVSTLYTYSSVPSSPSLYFPGNIDFDKYSFNYNKTSIGHFLQTDSSFTVSGFDSINFLKEHYFLPESNLNNYIRLTAFASNNGYLLQDDILYHDMYDGDSSEWALYEIVTIPDKHFDTVHLPGKIYLQEHDYEFLCTLADIDADKIILDENNKELYDRLIEVAASKITVSRDNLDNDSQRGNYDLAVGYINAANKIVDKLEGHEHYGSGNIEKDIENAEPLFVQHGKDGKNIVIDRQWGRIFTDDDGEQYYFDNRGPYYFDENDEIVFLETGDEPDDYFVMDDEAE